MRFLRRFVAVLVMILSTVVFIGCIAGMIGVWIARQRASEKVQDLSARIDVGLQRASAADREAQRALEKARDNLATVNRESANLSGGNEQNRLTTSLIRGVIQGQAGPRINEGYGRLAMFSDTAVVVASLLQSFQESPLGTDRQIDPEKLDQLSGQAAQLSAAFQKLRGVVGEGDTPASEKDVVDATREVDRILQRCLTVMSDIRSDLDAAREDLPRIKAKILGWMLLAAIVVTVVCAWVAVSQVSLFAHGWKWFWGA
jgi:hypothetical protein